ncbi:cystatin [Plakobranchus ocellatus]|uniref:Cystatin n=1 Tax=Plakobranchus ocellatus TaxID=259542 RepID=A0AAV3ZRB1_9GAST|nr:cystatin [Plakobranchus ocellatus]
MRRTRKRRRKKRSTRGRRWRRSRRRREEEEEDDDDEKGEVSDVHFCLVAVPPQRLDIDLSLVSHLAGTLIVKNKIIIMYAGLLTVTLLLPLATQAATLAGGISDTTLDMKDPIVQFASKAINTYYTMLGDSEPRTLVDIVSAQSQVVAGTLYHLVLRVKTMNQEELCKVEVWSRPWLSGDDATQVTKDPVCKMAPMDKSSMAPIITGGSVMTDIKNEDVQKALKFAVDSMNAQENFMYLRKPVKVEEVKSQVVSGMAYHFRGVHMAATTCLKNTQSMPMDLASCPAIDPADIRVCDFDIWWQSWMTPEYKLTSMQCQ